MSQSDSAAFIAGFPLKAHNTFGFDVRAQFACRIEREEQLMAAVRDPRAAGLPRLVLGGGSNVVLTGDFGGLVLLIAARPPRRTRGR
jgi:UDP-N-acetylmuramate dehydrogenase